MSAHQVAICCAACIYLVHGAFQWMGARVAPERKELPYFALGCVAMSAYCLTGAMILKANDLQSAAMGLNIQLSAAALVTTGFVLFQERLTRPEGGWVGHAVWLFTAVVVVSCLLGLCVAARPLPAPELELLPRPQGPQPMLTLWGLALLMVMPPFVGHSILRLTRSSPAEAESRAFLLTAGLALPALAHDALVRTGAISSVTLFEFAGLGLVLFTASMVVQGYGEAGHRLRRDAMELRNSAAALSDAQRELAQARRLAQVGEFAAIIAHEVRNPIAILRNASSRLQAASRPQEERLELLRIMKEETGQLDALVVDLARFTEPLRPQPAPLLLEPLLRHCVERARSARPEATQVRFEVRVEEGAQSVQGDERLLAMAVTNLVDNAVLALGAGGHVELVGEPLPNQTGARIRVRDNGSGMSAEAAHKALQPFFTTRAKGTGLGLAIVNRVARSLGGSVDLQTAGHGTTITISLPTKGSKSS